MGTLKYKGVDVTTYLGNLYNKDDNRTKQEIISTKIKGIKAEIDDGTKFVASGWFHNAFEGKLKYNGNIYSCAPQGTRPINETAFTKTGTNLTCYLVNENGILYYKTSPTATTGEEIVKSTEREKQVTINLALWGAGGKGGGGAYWFLKGWWGGIGGSSGAKAFYTLVFKNNAYCKISISNDDGRTSSNDTGCKQAPTITLVSSDNVTIATCKGGKSGIGSHPRWGKDNFDEVGSFTSIGINPVTKGNVTFYLRKKTNGAKKRTNGFSGNGSTFENSLSPYNGNPENILKNLKNSSSGGTGLKTSYDQGCGSGGAGGYENGGNAGDNSGGTNGGLGAGGGGAGSPNNGASGGDGGLAGFKVFY